MDLFSPSNLPGVGMGDLASIAAIGGAIGLAVTSGALIAEGAIGTIVFVLSAVLLLAQKADFGGSTPAALVVLSFLCMAIATRLLLEMRARREAAALAGAAKDSPETKAARSAIARRERWARWLAILATVWGGAAVGVAWTEWNEIPIRLGDQESLAGLAIGVVFASIGGDAAWRFVAGSIRAGGSVLIVGVATTIGAFAGNAASVYVPFAGFVVAALAVVLAVRLRRRDKATYAGLRILS